MSSWSKGTWLVDVDELDLYRHRRALPGLERDAVGEELPERAADGQQRQRSQRTRQAVQLRARREAEDDEQRVKPQRVAHDVRHDDVTLDLLDAEEEERDPDRGERMHDERVDERRRRAEPRAEIRDHLRERDPCAEEQRVLLRVRKQP